MYGISIHAATRSTSSSCIMNRFLSNMLAMNKHTIHFNEKLHQF